MLADEHDPPSELSGRTVGERYHLVRLLGGGGVGAVYEAEHIWTGRRVAVKLLHPQHQLDATVMQRFVREARAATAIQHPNIVQVLDMGLDRGLLYMVQELLEGRDLHDELVAVGRLSPQAALDLLFPVMGALIAAHQQGILHRDIKPENIFLVRDKTGVAPKLIDFGIAKMLAAPDNALRTGTGRPVGTPAYMAPEQVRGDVDVDARVDVWAIGVVLFQMLSGSLPFDAPTANLVMLRVMTQTAPRLCDVAPDVPAALGACVDRALLADRDRRYPSMRAFLGALLDCPRRVPGLDGALLRAHVEATLIDGDAPEAPTPEREVGGRRNDNFDEATRVRNFESEGVSPAPSPKAVAIAAPPPRPIGKGASFVDESDGPTGVNHAAVEEDVPTHTAPSRSPRSRHGGAVVVTAGLFVLGLLFGATWAAWPSGAVRRPERGLAGLQRSTPALTLAPVTVVTPALPAPVAPTAAPSVPAVTEALVPVTTQTAPDGVGDVRDARRERPAAAPPRVVRHPTRTATRSSPTSAELPPDPVPLPEAPAHGGPPVAPLQPLEPRETRAQQPRARLPELLPLPPEAVD